MIARPEVWVVGLAARFWAAVGDSPAFPRDLRSVLCWLPAVHVVGVPNLTLATAADHLARHGVPCRAPQADRPLAGCFGGHRWGGVILYDSALELAELLFTLAHETAHYLRDYDAERRKVAARLGPRALDVLDGLRPATPDERLAGILRGVTIGCHAHFLDRDRWGRVPTEEAREAEEAADRLAYELLAPFDAVDPEATPDRAALVARLTSVFGLPAAEAAKYAAVLRR